MKAVRPPRTQACTKFDLKHHGLYTEQEERDFVNMANLKYYKEQVTRNLIQDLMSISWLRCLIPSNRQSDLLGFAVD